MATQLQFSRHTHVNTSIEKSDISSSFAWETPHRHVAFAVHDAVPSPELYHRHHDQRAEEQVYDSLKTTTWEEPQYPLHKKENVPIRSTGLVRDVAKRNPTVKKPTSKKTLKAKVTQPAPTKPSKKPTWESGGGSTTSNLFDATLKKSVLFQPRPGDRLREVKQEEQQLRGTSSIQARKASSAWNARIATTLPSQPKRQPKDYVKMNMEKITGQRYETLVHRSRTTVPTRQRSSVFERLSEPVLHKSLIRFRSRSPTKTGVDVSESAEWRNDRSVSPIKLTISSPITSSPLRQEILGPTRGTFKESRSLLSNPSSLVQVSSQPTQQSPFRGRQSASRPSASTRSSPAQERRSSPSSRRPTSSRASSPGFRLDHSSPQNSMAEKVFEVLDREGRGRIGVEQILDGLRLLQLPATHNQVADYVYLIHEGGLNTIDHEEWAILVGTLDAASSSANPTSQAPSIRSRSSPPPTQNYSPPRSRSSNRSSPPRSFNQSPSPPKSIVCDTYQDTHKYPYDHGPLSLSVKMPDTKLAKIAKHSDDLAELLLDELLVDTVEELNKQEQQQTKRMQHYLHAEALDSILQQIHHIETAEAELINSGFVLGYKIDAFDEIKPPESRSLGVIEPSPQDSILGNLVLPLEVVMTAVQDNPDDASDVGKLVETLPFAGECEKSSDAVPVNEGEDTIYHVENPVASMACLSGRLYQSVEKNRIRFMKHRQIVESSLESTGMDQASVIEMLADLLLDEIAVECAFELESGVEELTETLAQTLL